MATDLKGFGNKNTGYGAEFTENGKSLDLEKGVGMNKLGKH